MVFTRSYHRHIVVSEVRIPSGTKLESISPNSIDGYDRGDHADGPGQCSNGWKTALPEKYLDIQGKQELPSRHPP